MTASYPTPSLQAITAWNLVQLTEVLRAAETASDTALRILKGIDTDLPHDECVSRGAEALADLAAALIDFGELADRATALGEQLPDLDVDADYDEVAAAAAHDLSDGIMDPTRARWAVELLDYRRGWPTLAEALRSSDAHRGWGDLTVGDLLGAFRDANATRVDEVIATTDLDAAARFADATAPQIALLATSLAQAAHLA